jgi:hypothetical protein
MKPYTGFEGTPIPYFPGMDDMFAYIFLVCFFISVYVLGRNIKLISQLGKDFSFKKERKTIHPESAITYMNSLPLLVIQTCILVGIGIFVYFHVEIPLVMEKINHFLLLVIYVFVFFLYLVWKRLLYTFLGWIFFDKDRSGTWFDSYYMLVCYAGFIIFPLIALTVYLDFSYNVLVILFLIVFIIIKTLIFHRWLRLFLIDLHGLLRFFLYFCALEIIPCFVTYQGLVQLNKFLIKF